MVSSCLRARLAATTAILLTLAAACATAVCAEVRVQGDATALQIDAKGSPVEDVLVELGKTMQVRVRASVALDKIISGTYSGSLNQVLARVLDGYNYVIKARDSGAEVVVVGGEESARLRPVRHLPHPAEVLPPNGAVRSTRRTPIASHDAGLEQQNVSVCSRHELYDQRETFRQAAFYVDRILKGANPGDLPIQSPTKFVFHINLTTAKALGIELPVGLMLRADELVE